MQDLPPSDDNTTQNNSIIDSEAVTEDDLRQRSSRLPVTDEATQIHVAVSINDKKHQTAPNPAPLTPRTRTRVEQRARAARKGGPPWWMFLIVAAVVLVITGAIWGFILLGNISAVAVSDGPTPTLVFVVITATPTTETSEPAAPPAVQAAPEQPVITATPAPQPIAVGSTVIVIGTEQAGLSVREGAGVAFPIFLIAVDGEIFNVVGGPAEADGFTWWNISDPADPTRTGWAAGAFLVSAP